MATDYDKIAAQFGGKDAPAGTVDYDSMAAKFGGKDAAAPAVQQPQKIGADAFGDTLRDTVRGASGFDQVAAAFGSGLSNVIQGSRQMMGMGDPQTVQANKIFAEESPVAALGGAAAAMVPAAFLPGANTVAGAGLIGAGYGLLQPADGAMDRTKNVVTGGVGGAAGQAAAGKLADVIAQRLGGANTAAQIANTAKQPLITAVDESKKAGYVIPPSSVNPNGTNRAIEAVGGKAATQQNASLRNQEVTNKLVRKGLGVAEGTPLTEATFAQVRRDAGQVYETLKGVGQFGSDNQFAQDIAAIAARTKSAGGFKTLENPRIDALVQDLTRPGFDSADAVELMKVLRASSKSNMAAHDDPLKSQLGQAEKRAAQAIEELVGRNLQAMDQANPGAGFDVLGKAFADARTTIAKSHNVQKATDIVSGNVDARKLGAQLQAGKPFTGDIRTAAEFGKTFDKAAQVPERMGSPVSAMQAMSSAVLGVLGANSAGPAGVAAAAIPFSRPIARAALLSAPYQKAMANVPLQAPGRGLTLADLLLQSPKTRGMVGGLSAQGVLGAEAMLKDR